MSESLPVPEPVETQVIVRMEAARVQLEQARTLGEAKRVADGAAAIREWLKRQSDLGLAIVNDASLLKLEAERRMGEFLQQPGAVNSGGRPEKPSQPGTVSAPTHRQLGISRQSAQRFEQVALVPRETLREMAAEATQKGVELTREAVLKAARRFRLLSAPSAVPDTPVSARSGFVAAVPEAFRNTVVTGDARELAKLIPDESVTVCFCDPVYERIEDYEWLARECERVLVPGGSVVAQCGNVRRLGCELAMGRSGLQFVDLLAEVYPYALCPLWGVRVQVGWKPYLWFSKGERTIGEWVMNRVHAKSKRAADDSKSLHDWGDAEQFTEGLLSKLCPAGSLVWDPFTGSGTVPVVALRLGLPFVAFEIDPQTAELARRRILTQFLETADAR